MMRVARLLPIFLLATLWGCGHDGISSTSAPDTEVRMFGAAHAVSDINFERGESVFEDGPDWQGWSILHSDQAWFDDEAKYLSFEPADGNLAYSPDIGGLRQLQVSFELFLPPRFPIFSAPDETETELFGLYSALGASSEPSEMHLSVKLIDGSDWAIEAAKRTIDGRRWSSGRTFLTPWLFEHGWNRVSWTVILAEPGTTGDSMRLRVGDRIYAWTDLDLRGDDEAFHYLRLGLWNVQRGDTHIAIRNLQIEEVEPPSQEPPPGGSELPPPPPPPPAGTVLYEQTFEGGDPFDGWLGRNTNSNLRIEEQSGNRYARLLFEPHSEWRISFLPRYEGVFNLRCEFAYRLPPDYGYRRHPPGHPKAGQIIGGGKHIFQFSNTNTYEHGRDALDTDGWVRLDFGGPSEFGAWDVTAYRKYVGGRRAGEFKRNFHGGGTWFQPGHWYQVRVDIHLNDGPGDHSGTCDLWVDGDHKGTFHGEFNVVGPTGGIRCIGFGNLDNLVGDPWIEIDNLRLEAR